ncbi:MAG: YrhA family protein [Arachnia sp.]
MNWKQSLNQINEINMADGYDPPPPVSNVDEFVLLAKSAFGIIIPRAFTEFWTIQNGLEYDGHVFYGADVALTHDGRSTETPLVDIGVISLNRAWGAVGEENRYTYLGDSNLDWFVYEIESERYLRLDKPSADVIEVFEGFDEFFSSLLSGLAG